VGDDDDDDDDDTTTQSSQSFVHWWSFALKKVELKIQKSENEEVFWGFQSPERGKEIFFFPLVSRFLYLGFIK